ncbi:MAG: hypothetical protein K0V04_33635 [Deltaproteobacteria bacterium]|nr:hypothetical protein [Deltaproteobacteria bacterium]
MTSVEQFLSQPFAMIPFPGFPAVRMLDVGFGVPHAHTHPPNLIPPAPPVPFPHPTVLTPIPILSGGMHTAVGGLPAGRCGDMGLSGWCGGFFPLCEIFLGSASVWIEMARAARVGVDITKHCIFSSPKPTDPPVGPMLGMTLSCSPNVLIGGIPFPSLTNLAIAAAFKGLFKALGAAGRGIKAMRAARAARRANMARAARYVDDLIRTNKIAIHGDDAFRAATRADLERLARTAPGRELLDDLASTGRRVDIHSPASRPPHPFPYRGPYAMAQNVPDSGLRIVPDPAGPFSRIHFTQDAAGNWTRNYQPGYHVRGTGPGSGTDVVYDPTRSAAGHGVSRGTPSDVILGHELNHARNNAHGRRANELSQNDPAWQNRWQDLEEADTVGWESSYREARNGTRSPGELSVPPRNDYGQLPTQPSSWIPQIF